MKETKTPFQDKLSIFFSSLALIINLLMLPIFESGCKKPNADVIYIHLPDVHNQSLSAKILNILYCGTNPLVAEDVDNVSFGVEFNYDGTGKFVFISTMEGEPTPQGTKYAGSDEFEFTWTKVSETEITIIMKYSDDVMHIDDGSRAYAMNQFSGTYTMVDSTFGVASVKYTKTGFVNANDCSIEFIRSNQ